jgi:hypothetical protein
MICFHKFSEVKEDGFQYCKKCGKAIMPKHKHRWIDRERHDVALWGESPTGAIIIQECSICGMLHNHEVGQIRF